MYTIETWSIFCSSHVHYRNKKYFLFFSYALSKWKVIFILSPTLWKHEKDFVSVIYIIKTWSSFCFFHVHYRNVKYFLFFSCMLAKREEFAFSFCRYTIEMWSAFIFLITIIETSIIFSFSHVHIQKVKQFLFFSGTLIKRKLVFDFVIYTIETWISFCFSHIHYRNVK